MKELEWERSVLQSEIESKQSNNSENSSTSVDEPKKEVFDAIKVLIACKYCFMCFCYSDEPEVDSCFFVISCVSSVNPCYHCSDCHC